MVTCTQFIVFLYYIHTKKLSCPGSGVEFDMNDIFYTFTLPTPHLRQLNLGVNVLLSN